MWEDEGGVEAVDLVEVAGGEGDFGGHFGGCLVEGWRFDGFALFVSLSFLLGGVFLGRAKICFVYWVLQTL